MRVIRLTGLVVFVAAVFLTFAGSNQLITDNSNDEMVRPGEAVVNTSAEPATNVTGETSAETPAVSSSEAGRISKSKPRTNRKNGSDYGVWQDHKGGKWVVETRWDGEKWVSKRVYHPSNKE
jgi:hypothetical protein